MRGTRDHITTAETDADGLPPGRVVTHVEPVSWPAGTPWQTAYRDFRAVADPVSALLLLVAGAPLMLAIALAIRLDSPGPVFFRQDRVGRGRRTFRIVKFRTMREDAPPYSPKVADDDPRITRVGRWLRRSCLDELPQLTNVIRGEMALIGPRPEQITLLPEYAGRQLARFWLKPGITGWWQVHHREPIPMHQNVERDLYYIANQGPLLDAKIIAMTLGVIIPGLLQA